MKDNEEISATWESYQAPAHVENRGRNRGPVCKVKTRDVYRLPASKLLARVRQLLREGMEVRLVDGNEKDAIRLYPLACVESNTLYPGAMTMDDFRYFVYDEIEPVYSWRGKQTTQKDLQKAREEAKAARRGAEMPHVTPDKTITCPECGATFRVGKALG